MIGKIHHINFLVRDLEEAVIQYKALLQIDQVVFEELPQRNVSTARFRVGETWVVLIQPHDQDSIPGRHMQEHGEGFFLISYQANDLEAESARIAETGIGVLDLKPRYGLDDWLVKDLSADDLFSVNTQITESSD